MHTYERYSLGEKHHIENILIFLWHNSLLFQMLWTCCLFNFSIYALLKSWLTTTKYLFNRRPWMCSVCRSHILILLSPFMTNHRMLNKNNTMGVPSGSGTAYSSGAPEFTPSSWWRLCCSVLYVVVCRPLFVFLSLVTIVFSVLRVTASA